MGSRNIGMFLEPGPETLNKNNLVAPTGFEPAIKSRSTPTRPGAPLLGRVEALAAIRSDEGYMASARPQSDGGRGGADRVHRRWRAPFVRTMFAPRVGRRTAALAGDRGRGLHHTLLRDDRQRIARSAPRKPAVHVLPNVLPDILVMGSVGAAGTIHKEGSLAIVGLGVKQPLSGMA
jgi:hypothetical protein